MRLLPLLSFVFIYFCSCSSSSRMVHSEACVNQPILTQKGDMEASVVYAGSNKFWGSNSTEANGLDLQAAYAFHNNWAALAAQSFRWEKDAIYRYNINKNPFDTSFVDYTRNLTTLSIGYFNTNKVSKYSTNGFSVFGGLLFGNNTLNEDGIADSSRKYQRFHQSFVFGFFLQPGFFHKSANGGFNFLVNLRIGQLRYNSVNTNFSIDEQQKIDLLDLEKRRIPLFIFNFQMQVRFMEGLYLQSNVTFNMFGRVYYKEPTISYGWRNMNLGIGIVVRPHEM
jgi:hypothetical protein